MKRLLFILYALAMAWIPAFAEQSEGHNVVQWQGELIKVFSGLGLILFIVLYHLAKKRKTLFTHWLAFGISIIAVGVISPAGWFDWLLPIFISIICIYPFAYTRLSRKFMNWLCVIVGINAIGISYFIISGDHWLIMSLLLTGAAILTYIIFIGMILPDKCPDCGWYAQQVKLGKEELEPTKKDIIKKETFARNGQIYQVDVYKISYKRYKVADMCPHCEAVHEHYHEHEEKELINTIYNDVQGGSSSVRRSSNNDSEPINEEDDTRCNNIAHEDRRGFSSICGHCGHYNSSDNRKCEYFGRDQVPFDEPACSCYTP